MRLELHAEIAAPRDVVWQVLTSWERQPEWMTDARAVHVLTPHRRGVGVTIRCPTRLLGVTVQDVMRVTGWEEARYLEIEHLGKVIRGVAAFELEDRGEGTLVRWWEEIDPPLGAVGEWGASTFALPVLRRVFDRSLTNFARLVVATGGEGRM